MKQPREKTQLEALAAQWKPEKEVLRERTHAQESTEVVEGEKVLDNLEEKLRQANTAAEARWKCLADAGKFDEVVADLDVYRYAGVKVEEDPRRSEDYRTSS